MKVFKAYFQALLGLTEVLTLVSCPDCFRWSLFFRPGRKKKKKPFLKPVFPEAPSYWLLSSALSSGGFPGTSTGQPFVLPCQRPPLQPPHCQHLDTYTQCTWAWQAHSMVPETARAASGGIMVFVKRMFSAGTQQT